jgi:hypothetical protein
MYLRSRTNLRKRSSRATFPAILCLLALSTTFAPGAQATLGTPAAPTVTLDSCAQTLTVTWVPVTGANNYYVETPTGSTWQSGTSYVDGFYSYSPGKLLQYRVTAKVASPTGSVTDSGPASAWGSVTTPASFPIPGPPTVSRGSSDSQVAVSWTPIKGVAGYRIRISDGGWVTAVASPAYIGTMVGTVSTYRMSSSCLNAPWSAATSYTAGTAPISSAPVVTTGPAKPTATAIAVSWAAVAGAQDYNVAWSTDSTMATGVQSINTGGPTTATIPNLLAATKYSIRATALQRTPTFFQGPASAILATGTVPWPLGTPGLTVASIAGPTAPGGRSVTLNLTAVTGATGYSVQRANDAAFTSNVGSATYTAGGSITMAIPAAGYWFFRAFANDSTGAKASNVSGTGTGNVP